MPDLQNQAASRQRRANWVALRTLRQLPKPAGETLAGDPIYEIRSVRLVLQGVGSNFLRLTNCSRCGRELAGAPVLTPADLDRPVQPMICTHCIRSAGVSTTWESEAGGAAMPPAEREPELAAAAPGGPPAEGRPARLDVLERHLRAVTDRVNELGRVARSQQADADDRGRRAEATASELRDELLALRASSEGTRAELQRLAGAHAELERRADLPPAAEAGAGAGPLREELARLTQLVEDQRAEVARLVTALGETQRGHAELAVACQILEGRLAEATAEPGADHVDKAMVEDLVSTRLAETEARLAEAAAGAGHEYKATVEELVNARWAQTEARLTDVIAAQRGELEGAIERSVSAFTSGFLRANEELAGGQAVLEERIEAIAGQVAQASSRLEGLLDRLDVLEAAGAWAPPENPDSPSAAAGDLLDNLDRQLEAAARRLAARGQAGANRGQR